MGLTWISDNKGAGAWPFTPQPDKPHYNEGNLISDHDNPVWKTDFSGDPVTPIHHPWCGYWTKDYVPPSPPPPDVNIFVLQQSGVPTIYGVNFVKEKLIFTGSYTSAEALHSLILYDNDLLTAVGEGVTAELRRISTEADIDKKFSLLDTHTPFNSYDVRVSEYGCLLNGDSGEFYYSDTSTVVVSIHDLVRVKRGFRNLVITGTDDNLYIIRAATFYWNSTWRPITGENWSTLWKLIEDNICDSTIYSWGDDIRTCASGALDVCFYNDFIYTVDVSSYNSPLTKLNSNSLETEVRCLGNYLSRLTAYNHKIYVLGGLTSTTVYLYNADTLELENSCSLPSGMPADLEVAGNFLIVSTLTYSGDPGTLYKLSLNDLTISDSVLSEPGSNATGIQRIDVIDNNYIVAAWNEGLSIYDVENLKLIDTLNLHDIDPTLGYRAHTIALKYN